MTEKRIRFIKSCFFIGAAADLVATLPLAVPRLAKAMFALERFTPDANFLYVSRIAASLMLGWTLLLLWGGRKPVERRGVLLLTLFPVLFGLVTASLLVARSGFVPLKALVPLWGFYAIVIPLYVAAYATARRAAAGK
jgi:hypothetical protein